MTIKNTIKSTQEQMEKLQAGESITIEPPKPSQWEPKGGSHYILGTKVSIGRSMEEYRQFGLERTDRAQALKAVKAMRIHNRLLAYVEEFDPNYNPDWVNPDDDKYFVYYDNKHRKWFIASHLYAYVPGSVYMSKACAKTLLTKLNSGEVVL